MKKLLILAVILISSFANCQKIVENKVDDFTKKSIIRTDWERITGTSDLWLYARISKINDTKFLELKFFTKGVSSMREDDVVAFMFENGDVLNIKNTKYKISNYGDGAIGLSGSNALGLNIDLIIDNEMLLKFQNEKIKKIRINQSEGYQEEELKAKFSEKFQNMFKLIEN